MRKIKKFFSAMVVVFISFGLVIVCFANAHQNIGKKDILLVVLDQSKETYGKELQEAVYTQINQKDEYLVQKDSTLIANAEQPALLELAKKEGVNKILVIEILPTKSEFSDFIFYKAIKSEATLKIRFYDAIEKQYILNETVAGVDGNKTYIPYTGVGKKTTVLQAVHRAAEVASQKIMQWQEEK